jgi:hypothetical protein
MIGSVEMNLQQIVDQQKQELCEACILLQALLDHPAERFMEDKHYNELSDAQKWVDAHSPSKGSEGKND